MKCHFNEVSTPIVIIRGTWWGCTGCLSVRWVVKWGTMPSCKCPSGKRLLSLLWSDIWRSVPWCIWGTSSRFETGPQHSVWCLPSAKAVIKETVIFTQQVNAEGAKGVGWSRGYAPCWQGHTSKTQVKSDIPTKSYAYMSTSWPLGNVYTAKSCKDEKRVPDALKLGLVS